MLIISAKKSPVKTTRPRRETTKRTKSVAPVSPKKSPQKEKATQQEKEDDEEEQQQQQTTEEDSQMAQPQTPTKKQSPPRVSELSTPTKEKTSEKKTKVVHTPPALSPAAKAKAKRARLSPDDVKENAPNIRSVNKSPAKKIQQQILSEEIDDLLMDSPAEKRADPSSTIKRKKKAQRELLASIDEILDD